MAGAGGVGGGGVIGGKVTIAGGSAAWLPPLTQSQAQPGPFLVAMKDSEIAFFAQQRSHSLPGCSWPMIDWSKLPPDAVSCCSSKITTNMTCRNILLGAVGFVRLGLTHEGD